MALHVSHFLKLCNGLLFLTNSSFDILQIWHVHLQVYAFKTALQTRKSFETHHLKAGGWLGFLMRKYRIHHQKSNMLKFQVDGWDGHEDESKQKWTFLGWSYHPLFLSPIPYFYSDALASLGVTLWASHSLILSALLICCCQQHSQSHNFGQNS